MNNRIPKYVMLLLTTAVGGVATSFMWLRPNGLMAGCMSFCFSLGTIWLAEKEHRKPGSIDLAHVIAAGLITGLIASIPLMLLETTRQIALNPELAILRPPALECWYLIAAPVLYGVAFHWSYHQRHGRNRPFRSVVWRIVLLTGGIRLGLEAAKAGSMPHMPAEFLPSLLPVTLFFLVFVSPFPIGWTLLTSLWDPAWARRSDSKVAEPELTAL